MPQTTASVSYYYVAKPSAQLRANVVQAFNTILYLRRVCPNMHVILSSRSQTINDVFGEFDPIYPTNKKFNDVFSHLHRGSLVRSSLEAILYSLTILKHVLLHDRRSRKVFYCRSARMSFVLALILCPLLRSKLVVEAHSVGRHYRMASSSRFANIIRGFMERITLTRADSVVVLTQAAVQRMQTNGYRVDGRIYVIPHGFDPAVFYPRDRDACRQQLGLDRQTTYIVYSGLTFTHRQIEKLVYAAGEIKSSGAVEFIVVGGQPRERIELERLAAARGVSNKVKFVGIVDQQQAALYLGAANVLVIPGELTTETGSPLKLVEYMAMGQPIVCPDSPVYREVVDDEAVYFFTGALSTAIEEAICDPLKASQKGAAVRQLADQYSYENRANRIFCIMEHLGARA
jgi:glycosyltransferase involved in cell wall biosynthesis